MLESLVFIKGGKGSTGLSSLANMGFPCSSTASGAFRFLH